MPLTLENLTKCLPAEGAWPLAVLSLAGALVGVVLWLMGSRVGRSFMTLLAVAIGAMIGLKLPEWFSLRLSNWSTAVGGALVLGVSAYAMHKVWVSMGLGLIVALWVGLGVMAVMGVDKLPDLPEGEGRDYVRYAADSWSTMPENVRRVGPVACGIGLLGGVIVGIIFCKLAVYLMYSLLGVSMFTGLGLLTAAMVRPQLLNLVPAHRSTRLAILAGMVLFGVLVQWRLSVKPAPPPPPKEKEE